VIQENLVPLSSKTSNLWERGRCHPGFILIALVRVSEANVVYDGSVWEWSDFPLTCGPKF
jgi:hypothetical protein